MDAIKSLAEFKRMCKTYQGCAGCCAIENCNYMSMESDAQRQELVVIVERWSKDHPKKTRVQDEESADVAPVAHARWIDIYESFETAECSRCHSQFEVTFNGEANGALWDGFNQFYNYCPNCGAKMDLEED